MFGLVMFLLFVLGNLSVFGFSSTISGIVYNQSGRPLAEIDVELLNENYVVRQRTKSDGVGRYTFNGVVDGRYYVRALPFRYDLEDAEVLVEVTTYSVRGEGVGFFSQDIFLKPKRGGLGDTVTGVVFAEDVPKEALEFYKEAQVDLAKNRKDEAFEKLKKAISLYPKYYAALFLFGKELLAREMYLQSAQAFLQAVNVNPKSSNCFYYAGLALSRLGKDYYKASIASLNSAAQLAPNSFQVFYLLGKLERLSKNFAAAEKHLLRAKKNANTPIPEIHIELAQLYANDLKQFKQAADELELYLKASNPSKEEQEKLKKQIADLRKKEM